MKLIDATAHCKSLNANQILPRSRQESDDLVAALLSLDLDSEDGKTLVSIGIYKSKEGEWFDSEDQLISYFNWLPGQPDDLSGSKNYAGFRIDGINETVRWDEYNGNDELNIICTKTVSYGKNYGPLLD